jgi:hypothetical protein
MQITTTITAPLGAGAIYNSGPAVTPLDFPYLAIVVSADQAGTLLVFDAGSDGSIEPLVTMPVIANAAPAFQWVVLRGAELYRVEYLNGATAQTAFALSIGTLTAGIPPSSDQRVQRLILRELRAISMLLAALKEPTSSTPNIPFGATQITPA